MGGIVVVVVVVVVVGGSFGSMVAITRASLKFRILEPSILKCFPNNIQIIFKY
jgi:hypothetical protein